MSVAQFGRWGSSAPPSQAKSWTVPRSLTSSHFFLNNKITAAVDLIYVRILLLDAQTTAKP
jgi:hypothetical protein